MSYLNDRQAEQLLRAINGNRVGTDGKGFSHVEAYEIRAHLNRIFGFGRWSADVLDQQPIFEDSEQREKNGRTYAVWTVAYRTILRLTVCAPDGTSLATYTEGAVGDASNQPSRADAHDLALKTSESQALKRCAANLGDQFGLSLYAKGSKAALVKATLVTPDAQATAEPVDSHITAPQPHEDETPAEPEPSAATTNEPAPPDPGEQERQAKADALRDQIIAAKDGKALRDLAPQMRGVQTEVVADADGKPVVLAALLKRRLAELSGVAA